MLTQAEVNTTSGVAYLRRLCRHFAHKVPATLSGHQGIIEFSFGRCRIDAMPDHLALVIDVRDERQLDVAEGTVTDHLKRMAHREDLTVEWVRGAQ